MRTYSYVDQLYFLKQGDGPWGTRSWTYDRIGNRLSETRSGATDTYGYLSSHNPKLTSIALGAGGSKTFFYDPVGNELQEASPTAQLDLSYDGANRLTQLTEETTRSASVLSYDGRNFLVQSRQDPNACSPVVTQSFYSSDGLLLGRTTKNLVTGAVSKDTKILYFAGRPVAFVETSISPAVPTYLSVDHLGTPILETSAAGTSQWSGGFEPFGKDWNGAQAAGEFLRFPGQWEDASWSGTSGAGVEYNVNRWYEEGFGRYSRPDPLLTKSAPQFYLYANDNPVRLRAPLGLYKMADNCSFSCRNPSLSACNNDPSAACAFKVMNAMYRRAQSGPCRQALVDAGVSNFTDLLQPSERTGPLISCDQSNCSRGTSTGGITDPNIFLGGTTYLCAQLFSISWEQAEQAWFHEFLHNAGLSHGPKDDAVLRACYPTYAP